MYPVLENKIQEIRSAIDNFTLDPQARLLVLKSMDNEYDATLAIISLLEEKKLDTPDIVTTNLNLFTGKTESLSTQLILSLCRYYDTISEALCKDGFPAWKPKFPVQINTEDNLELFIKTMNDFFQFYEKSFDRLIFFIFPNSEEQEMSFFNDMERILSYELSPRIRFAIIHRFHDKKRSLSWLNNITEKYIIFEYKENINDIMLDTLVHSEIPEGDAKKFQYHLLKVAKNQEENDPEESFKNADIAYSIALQNDWKLQQVSALCIQFSNFMNAKKNQEAYKCAKKATEVAKAISKEDFVMRDQLEATTQMTAGIIPQQEKDYELAAYHYEQAGIAYESADDALMIFESWRLCSDCYAKAHLDDKAWLFGEKALIAAKKIPRNVVHEGTIPFLGKSLKPIAMLHHQHWNFFEQEMLQLLGTEWKSIINNAGKDK